MRRRRQLSTRILASVVGILMASTVVGFALVTLRQRAEFQHEYQQRALAIAQTFATMPSIRQALARRTAADRRMIQSLAEQVREKTGATYIVVIDRNGVRYSHIYPWLIGQRVTEPVVALDGRDHLGVDHGNIGVSANAKVPIRAPGGPDSPVIGEVSAGILEGQVSDQLLHELPSLLLYFACALAIGVVASLTLARRLKRSTFGLELEEIAALVQEREAMLHGIREGVVALDRAGSVTLVNDEARLLIPFQDDPIGKPLHELVPDGRLRDLLTGAVAGQDSVVVTDDHILVVNRMPVVRKGRDLGAVITLRDRTELEGLLRELDSVDALTDALRAQQHEFANRMHTVAGLIELGDRDAAVRYALDVSGQSAGRAESIRERVEAPELAALLMAKTTVAAERGVELELSEGSRLAETAIDTNTMLSIVGNLIDNAIDAAVGPGPAKVTVRLTTCTENVTIEVSDTGPGVPKELSGRIFTDGFTTKSPDGRRHRGIGLALVHRLVSRAGGTIEVDCSGATTFTVVLPTKVRGGVEVSA
ncbi:MAG TPA: sensor histidine kinase [Solirubrobacteraceae bacterium]|jgi:two-component system CitB family sensor kinase|nr:sensor histidine kinase [Solirubrobacteraceae bacterium]